MNNENFGYDCRNNANNTKFQPIIDDVNEITYIKNNITSLITKFQNLQIVTCLSNKLTKSLNKMFLL